MDVHEAIYKSLKYLKQFMLKVKVAVIITKGFLD